MDHLSASKSARRASNSTLSSANSDAGTEVGGEGVPLGAFGGGGGFSLHWACCDLK